MKKIFCPVDFSNAAQNAIANAAKLSKATGSVLKLVNIQPAHAVLNDSDYELAVAAVGVRLEELSEEVRRFLKISCETEIIQSPALLSDAIVRSSGDSDLIVMGTHGRRGLNRMVLGSDAEAVLRDATVPVLMIKSTERKKRP